jgi:hypothetical protein
VVAAREWHIGGVDAADRLMGQIQHQRWRTPDTPPPNEAQVAMVLHALADHTALEAARVYDRTRDGKEDDLWPTSLSIGRWLHDLGDYIEHKARQ